ncbi:unnamed protein product [Strongylus vulgaris]|uniref:Uncharacterized protein n=1 Tax=Strongylus vulgaris TaxID=40348 RepID=A0A3P7IR13_STRVU|nr:unnamed protein product [Strongylus vulgaris]
MGVRIDESRRSEDDDQMTADAFLQSSSEEGGAADVRISFSTMLSSKAWEAE